MSLVLFTVLFVPYFVENILLAVPLLVAFVVVFEKFSVLLYVDGSEIMSPKANFPTELRTDTCVLPSLRLPAESEFNIDFLMCCCLQALRESPGHAKDIVILLALYREVAVQQGMWARNQLDVCCVLLIWYLTVVQDPSLLINLFAKFLEHVLSCKVFTF